jgi:hypothetical protein
MTVISMKVKILNFILGSEDKPVKLNSNTVL